jgi:two-component system, NarL family, invasion response regulator UvrY
MGTDGKRIRVLVAEDNPDLAAAICALIAAEPDMQVDGTAASTTRLLDAAVAGGSHVLVLDLDLGGESSVPALVHLQRSVPRLAVIVYSGHDSRDLGAVLTLTNCSEYVTKTGDPEELISAIRRAAGKAAGAGD